MTIKLLLFLGLVLLVPLSFLSAQSNSDIEPLSKLTFRLSGVNNSNRNTFHTFWTPSPGGEIQIGLPFYLGEIQGGSRLFVYDNKFEDLPDFISNFIFLGWGLDLQITNDLNWLNGIRSGVYNMYFDDEDTHVTQRTESELALEIFSRLDYNIYRSLQIHASAGYVRVYTFKRLEFFMLSAGLGYSIETPSWMKDFFE